MSKKCWDEQKSDEHVFYVRWAHFHTDEQLQLLCEWGELKLTPMVKRLVSSTFFFHLLIDFGLCQIMISTKEKIHLQSTVFKYCLFLPLSILRFVVNNDFPQKKYLHLLCCFRHSFSFAICFTWFGLDLEYNYLYCRLAWNTRW